MPTVCLLSATTRFCLFYFSKSQHTLGNRILHIKFLLYINPCNPPHGDKECNESTIWCVIAQHSDKGCNHSWQNIQGISHSIDLLVACLHWRWTQSLLTKIQDRSYVSFWCIPQVSSTCTLNTPSLFLMAYNLKQSLGFPLSVATV